jgi:succinate-semialdehyde dehydrogenase/glutarate-semialdehyde dehydrogenase
MTLDITQRRSMWINGQWQEARGKRRLGIMNPADESLLTEVPWGDEEDAHLAVDAAAKAFDDWRARSVWERGAFLERAAKLLRERVERYARVMTMEQGKPLAESRGEILMTADTLEWSVAEAKRAYGRSIPATSSAKRHWTLRHPVGVVATITPWNFPMTLASRKIAPALAVGCTVVCRPADQTPLSLLNLLECLEDAGLPAGVANGFIGDPVAFSNVIFARPEVRKISFTGSTMVGKELMRRAADKVKRLSLELGGHAPFIVFPDVDLEAVTMAAVAGKFRNNGQVCICPSRFYAHRDIAARFTEMVVAKARALTLGNGLEAGVQVGPMFEKRFLDKTVAMVEDARQRGSRVLTGGERSRRFEKGFFFEPTVLQSPAQDSRLMNEEPFAPILPILEFSSSEEVLAAANQTPYGLAAYVFTRDLSTAVRMSEGLEAGIIGLNDPVPTTVQCPFGGMKESGLGREMGREGVESYLETKFVSLAL